MEILFVIVGLAVGAGLTYLYIQKQLGELKDAQKARVRQMREDMERDFELRLQTAVQAAQTDHDRTLQQVRTEYEQRIARLQSQSTSRSSGASAAAASPAPAPLADPWDNRRAVAPAPAPTPELAPVVTAPTPEPVPSPAASTPDATETAAEFVAVRPVIAQLKQGIHASDPEIRAQVASELADHLMGAEAGQSLALLEKLAGDRQAVVRIAALETLADAQIPDTIPLLSQALRDSNPAVVRIASKGLQGMKGQAIAPAVTVDDLPSNGVPQRP